MSRGNNGNGPDTEAIMDYLVQHQLKQRELLIQQLVAIEDFLLDQGAISRRAVVSNRMRK